MESMSVTVTLEESDPLAVTDKGDALMEEVDVLTAPATKVTEAVEVRVIESVVSVAVNVATPACVDRTVKVTTPELFDEPEGPVTVSPPRLELSVTVFPETGLSLELSKVTVITEEEVPLAVTEAEEEVTVE